MENLQVACTVLITGMVVVFAVLILLIAIIQLYGTAVYKVQQKSQMKKQAAEKARQEQENKTVKAQVKEEPEQMAEQVPDGISPQIVAVIAAAADAMYGEGNVKVKSIKRLPQSRPVWSTAGIMDNTRPF